MEAEGKNEMGEEGKGEVRKGDKKKKKINDRS